MSSFYIFVAFVIFNSQSLINAARMHRGVGLPPTPGRGRSPVAALLWKRSGGGPKL